MTDRPRGDGAPEDGSPDFHWLYGGGARPDGAEPRPDETRVMPTQPRPSGTPVPPPTTAPGRSSTPPVPPRPAPTPGPTAPPPRRRRGFRFWLRLVLVLLLLWVVYLVAVPVWAWTKVDKVDFEPSGKRPGDQPGTTYLMVGSDSRARLSKEERKALGTGNASGQRTDTIMLLHTGDGPNLLMSIPRDSLVEIPGHGTSKINAAYAYGGAKLLTRTIELNTGIRVDEYVEIGLGGLAGVVDAVGGIEICPTFDMKDKLANLDIEKGCQEADGATALGYARSRHTDPRYGDITRVKHQREVVAAVGDKVLSPWTFVNPVRYWRLAMAVPDFFAFGEGTGTLQAGKWATAMTNVDLSCVVPISDLVVHWDPQRSQQMFDLIKEDKTADVPKALCTPTGLPKSVTG
ncbi:MULTISPECIES: LCP family protein [unclassified Nocardioides]|uniref:LCP family protein n=1 Tax=unclassified Nocardioides TaxID=2615069 RepID=UPI0009F1577E|nr:MULTISPECIES: LCP family protein [unclassified Nocardioides]GAW52132.1 cell envelope-related transcriptional attenuator [Nocardioides sp. PD653-B2]GAW57081.1 cell envelope-related transcriptional attenuator [Nocardioides sp. PD653]